MNSKTLTPTVFYILLALSDQDRHGYGIMKRAAIDSAGEVRIAAGTLYNALQRLVDSGLVAESGERPAPELDDDRRIYYALTEQGRTVLQGEVERLRQAVDRASQRLSAGQKVRSPWTE